MLEQLYPNLHHVGVVVRDINQAGRDNTERFGLGAVVRRTTLHVENALYRGKRVTYSAEFGFIDLGNAVIELIQPVGSEPSPYFDALNERGDNTHHLAYVIPSIEQHLEAARNVNASPSLLLDASLPAGTAGLST